MLKATKKGENNMEKVILQLEQLGCPSCIKKIETGVLRIAGVESAQLMFNSSKVKVTFDPNETNKSEIKGTIENLGYQVK